MAPSRKSLEERVAQLEQLVGKLMTAHPRIARDESHKLKPTGDAGRHRLVEARCNMGMGETFDR